MNNDHLLAKWLDGTITDEELEQFRKDEDYALYAQIKDASGSLSVPHTQDNDEQLRHILQQPQTTSVVRSMPSYRKSWFAAAASVLLLLTAALIYVVAGRQHIRANDTATAQVILPDQSTVTLAHHADLRFNSSTWRFDRDVKLEGEAYFNVAKGKTFTVQTPNGSVEVLGTQFNVEQHNGIFNIACYEGSVAISSGQYAETILAGQSVTLTPTGFVRDSVFIKQPAWTTRELIFSSTPLKGVVAELKKAYGVDIVIGEGLQAVDNPVTAVLPANDLDMALAIVEKLFAIKSSTIADKTYQLDR